MANPDSSKTSLKQSFILALQTEIADLTAKLEAKNKELAGFQAVPDETFDRIYQAGIADKAVTQEPATPIKKTSAKTTKKKGKGTGTTHMTDEQKATLEKGFLSILAEGSGEMLSKDLKPKFLELEGATVSRFGTIKDGLLTTGKISQEGKKAGVKYKRI